MSNEMISVPRDLLAIAEKFISAQASNFPKINRGQSSRALNELSEELRALLAKPAEQHQAEPVYMVRTHGSCCWEEVGSGSLEDFQSMPEEYEIRTLYTRPAEQPALEAHAAECRCRRYGENNPHWPCPVHSSAAEKQPAPVAVVPDGYCIMPRHLTAENGAKALLLGEFKLRVTTECPECCELEEPTEGCEICDGEGEYGQKHTIPWDLIKLIYSKAVEGLAMKTEPAKSR